MDEMDLVRDTDLEKRKEVRRVVTADGQALEMVLEMEEKPKTIVEERGDPPLKPVVRFYCDFPSTFPEQRKFGLQFTCLGHDDGRVVVKRKDEFLDMDGHTVEHEEPELPYMVKKLGVVGQDVYSRDLIIVVLSPEEFTRLLEDLTADREITVDISRQIEEATLLRSKKTNVDYKPNISKFEDHENAVIDKIPNDLSNNIGDGSNTFKEDAITDIGKMPDGFSNENTYDTDDHINGPKF